MKKIKLVFIIFISIFLLLGLGLVEHFTAKSKIIENWNFTDEQIEEYGPFWITVPAAENVGIPTDVDGIQFEDDRENIYLVFPEDVKTDRFVIYIRDGYESNYEARRVLNFDEEGYVQLAGKTIWMIKTDVPVIYIETDEENMTYSELRETEDRESICTGKMYNSDLQGATDVILKPRGNATWSGPVKKPFSIHTNERYNLFNLGRVSSWNLLADYFDPSLLRNYTVNNLAHLAGIEYEPDMTHAILYINRQFEGVYLLSTKVKVDKETMNLKGDDWLICWGATRPKQMIKYESKSWFSDTDYDFPYVELEYPKNETEKGLEEKGRIIQEYVDAVEDETSDRFLRYLDIEGMAKYYWVQEMSMNVDAAFRSTYTYWDSASEKMHFTSLWDFDLSLGQNAYKPRYDGGEIDFSNPEGWKIRDLAFYHELFEHPEFVEAVNNEYYRDGGVREAFYEVIDVFENERNRIIPIARLDYIKYKAYPREYELFTNTDTYDEYSDKVLKLYKDRLEWIDSQMMSN